MLTVVLQAGGQSRRMGQDKALMPFAGQPLIARVLARMRPYADEILVTTNRPEAYRFLGVPLFTDWTPGWGALGGLQTALRAARQPFVAVVACDMPFASGAFLRFGAEYLYKEGSDVFVPRTEEGYEPLHAVYRRETCLPAVEAAIEQGERRVISWYEQVRVFSASTDIVQRFDSEGVMFWNVNTPEAFAAAEAFARRYPHL